MIKTTALSNQKRVPLFEYPTAKQCCRCGNLKEEQCQRCERAVTLFTLGQGDPIVIVVDYQCERCSEWNVYPGQFYGVVTARKHTAYSLELMYC